MADRELAERLVVKDSRKKLEMMRQRDEGAASSPVDDQEGNYRLFSPVTDQRMMTQIQLTCACPSNICMFQS